MIEAKERPTFEQLVASLDYTARAYQDEQLRDIGETLSSGLSAKMKNLTMKKGRPSELGKGLTGIIE